MENQRLFVAAVCGIVAALLSTNARAQLPPGTWALRFDDEFNESYAGNMMGLDPDKWNSAYPWGRTHNYPAYIRDENIHVNANNSGVLSLASKRENYGGQPFTSGAVNTNGLLNFHTGYMEARMKMPNYLGAWPGFWMLQDGWPPELDIMEARFRSDTSTGYGDMYSYVGTYHWSNNGTETSAGTGFKYVVPNLTADFHNYGTLWTANSITWYFDGQVTGSYSGSAANIAQMQNMYLLLNLGVGGWPGDPPSWEDVNKSFDIDWVRVWQTAGAAASTYNGGAGYQQWDAPANWNNGSPKLANMTAVFGNVSGVTNAQLDWNGTTTLQGLQFKTGANYQIAYADDQLQLSTWGANGSNATEALIDVQVDPTSTTQGTQTIGARVELFSNTRVRNATGNTLTFLGDVHGSGSLTLDSGKTAFNGTLIHSGGTTLTGAADATINGSLVTPTATVYVGTLAGSSSTLRLAASATRLQTSHLRIADNGGAGTLIQAGGDLTVNGGELWVGQATGSVGRYAQSGGTVTVSNWLAVGRGGGIGTYTLGGGTLTKTGTAGNLILGSLGGTGTFNQSGGTVDLQNGDTLLGEDAGANGIYTITGGVASLHDIVLSQRATGNGTFNLNGGTVTTTGVRRAGTGTGNFYFNGGILRPGASTTTFMQGLSVAAVSLGGASFDTNGFDATVAQSLLANPLSAGGGLNKSGLGTLTLTGANTYTGTTTVNAGKLVVGSTQALGSGGNALVLGGTLSLSPSLSVAVKFKTLTVSAFGKFELNAAGLVIDYADGTTSPDAAIASAAAAGRFTSLLSGADPRIGVGYAEASALGRTSFSGLTGLDASALIVTSALFGDSDLSGKVDFTDLLTLAQNYGAGSGKAWIDGDANYDHAVNFNDLLALAQNYGGTIASTNTLVANGASAAFAADWVLAQSLAPEPTALLALGGAGMILARRRR